MRGMQCPKMLWMDAHKPQYKTIPPETQRRLINGDEFGEKAKAMFGFYTDVTEFIPNTKYLDKRKMIGNTRNAMRKGENNICEASFDFCGTFCAVDVLHRVKGDVWEMYEVKNSPELRPEHIRDAAYQAWVLTKCGVRLKGVFVVYHVDDDLDPFCPVDVTKEATEYFSMIEDNLDRLAAVKDSPEEIMIPCGEQCGTPHECWYRDYCMKLAERE